MTTQRLLTLLEQQADLKAKVSSNDKEIQALVKEYKGTLKEALDAGLVYLNYPIFRRESSHDLSAFDR